jgi:hypothetical protein
MGIGLVKKFFLHALKNIEEVGYLIDIHSVDNLEQLYGEVSEWLKEHAWKVCKRL